MSQAATPHPMTLDRERTALVVIDVQERLFPAMDADHREEVMRNIKVLTATAGNISAISWLSIHMSVTTTALRLSAPSLRELIARLSS